LTAKPKEKELMPGISSSVHDSATSAISRRPHWYYCIFAFFFFFSTTVQAQTYLNATGMPTFVTGSKVENGFINLGNGNLHLEIPLGSFPSEARWL